MQYKNVKQYNYEKSFSDFICHKVFEKNGLQNTINAYGLTVTFNDNKYNSNPRHNIIRLNKIFRHSYIRLCKYEFGRRFAKKYDLQTDIHSFIDVSGSRYDKKDISNIADSPHIHAITIPDKSKFHIWKNEDSRQKIIDIFESSNAVQSVDLQKIDNSQGLDKFIRYAMKFYIPNRSNQNYSDELYKMYPDFDAYDGLRQSQ